MTTPDNDLQALTGEISRCDCGTVSPPILTDHPVHGDSHLTEWEASHLQFQNCPLYIDRAYDEHTELWTFPTLPTFTREPAELAATTDTPTWHQPLKADIANRLVATHTQEPTP